MAAIFKNTWPYAKDALNLPVKSVDEALPFYQTEMGFDVISRQDNPKLAILSRDEVRIGVCENGGDPAQEGCFFEVNDVEAAFEDLKARGLKREKADFRIDRHGTTDWKVFFVVAPDGLCYCLGQRQ